MSHNTPKANAEFRAQWDETNLRYLLGDSLRDEAAIERAKTRLEESKKALEAITARDRSI